MGAMRSRCVGRARGLGLAPTPLRWASSAAPPSTGLGGASDRHDRAVGDSALPRSGPWRSAPHHGGGGSSASKSSSEKRGMDLQSERQFLSAAANCSPSILVPEALLNHLLETEAMYLASDQIRGVSMQEILDCLCAYKVAKFIHAELPKRLAVRIRMIDKLIDWKKIPELTKVRTDMQRWFRSMRLVRRGPDVGLQGFLKTISTIKTEGKDVVADVTVGMLKLRSLTSNDYSDEFLNRWMDDFFMIRIGSNMLVDQCIALASKEEGGLAKPTGIVDMECDATQVCEQAAEYAKMLCQLHTGHTPHYSVETYVEGRRGPQLGTHRTFSHVPAYLRYMMVELLKNAFKATVECCSSEEEIRAKPVRLLVSADDHHIAVRIADRGGGIPYHLHSGIWSYLYGRAAHSDKESSDIVANPLGGYGVGLPLSRLHARYLGGTLHLSSFPGYGTDASLHLPIIQSQQIEIFSRRCRVV